jgi:molybdenum cofactor cytidylyltransferase
MNKVHAIILAAGLSRRMGAPKMLLPWKNSTVLGQVITVLQRCDLAGLHIITGGSKNLVETEAEKFKVACVFNPKFENGEMIDSIKVGLDTLPKEAEAVLIALGDQPQIQSDTVDIILGAYLSGRFPIILPSYQMRRGHPWLIQRNYWRDILRIQPPGTMRDFFTLHEKVIHYETVNNASILMDLDTPSDYQNQKPVEV